MSLTGDAAGFGDTGSGTHRVLEAAEYGQGVDPVLVHRGRRAEDRA